MGTEYEGWEIPPLSVLPPTPLMVCFDALKPAWPKQLPMEPVRTRGYGAEAAWGRMPLPSSAATAAHRFVGCRNGRVTAEIQLGFGTDMAVLYLKIWQS